MNKTHMVSYFVKVMYHATHDRPFKKEKEE